MIDEEQMLMYLVPDFDEDNLTNEHRTWIGEEVRDDVYARVSSYRDVMRILVEAMFAWAYDIQCVTDDKRDWPTRINRLEAMRLVRSYIDLRITEEEHKARLN